MDPLTELALAMEPYHQSPPPSPSPSPSPSPPPSPSRHFPAFDKFDFTPYDDDAFVLMHVPPPQSIIYGPAPEPGTLDYWLEYDLGYIVV